MMNNFKTYLFGKKFYFFFDKFRDYKRKKKNLEYSGK